MDEIIKILFAGIDDSITKVIENHLSNTSFLSVFCNLDDAETSIRNFRPDMMIAVVLSSNSDYENHIQNLKIISDSNNIIFSVIVNRCKEEPYFFLIKNHITNIITFPINKDDFLRYINKFLCLHDSENLSDKIQTDLVAYSCNDAENSLISNLVIQNKMVTNNPANVKTDDFEKIHFEKINEQRIVEKKLWEAYDNNYFRLFYQPVIAIDSGKLAGFEALIRIIHPENGLIPPDSFISVAENSAIIFPLGLWIIEEACRQINIWKKEFYLNTPLRVNVNLSAKQFIHPELTSHIFEITERLNIEENDIAFELTESAFMEDMESANIALLELRAKKFALYMDDFGTGYSSLSYLMHFPVNVIKIDQSFVKWMHIDEQSETLVKSLVALAHNLGLKVVAEGTDDASHIEILKECGCDYAQGYYFAKPLPADDAGRFIANHFKYR